MQDHDGNSLSNLKEHRSAMIDSFFDWCGLAIPSGTNLNNIPTSVLISARHGHDADILSSGLSLESLIRPA